MLVLHINSECFAQSNNSIVTGDVKQNFENSSRFVEVFETYDLNQFTGPKGVVYRNVEGICSDGNNIYVALLTKNDLDYVNQEAKLIKIDIKTKKIIKENYLGRIGHCSSLTFNDSTQKIYCAPASKSMPFIYEINDDLTINNKIYLRDNKLGKRFSIKKINYFSYNKVGNNYIANKNTTSFSVFDSDFVFIKNIDFIQHKIVKNNNNLTIQAFTSDGHYFYALYNDLTCNPSKNYIFIYDLNGKFLNYYVFDKELVVGDEKRIEFEQLTNSNNDYYIVAKIFVTGSKRAMRIYKLSLPGQLPVTN